MAIDCVVVVENKEEGFRSKNIFTVKSIQYRREIWAKLDTAFIRHRPGKNKELQFNISLGYQSADGRETEPCGKLYKKINRAFAVQILTVANLIKILRIE